MEQTGLKRHAALAITMVGVVALLVAAGREIYSRGGSEEGAGDEQESWQHFSRGCASHRLKTPPVEEPAAVDEPAPIEPPLAALAAPEQADYLGCGTGDFWRTTDVGPATPLTELPSDRPGEESR